MSKEDYKPINSENIDERIELVKNILKNSKIFMDKCNPRFDRGFIGELLVLLKLMEEYKSNIKSNVENNIIFWGASKPNTDMSFFINGREIRINAKATTTPEGKNNANPKWVRQSASNFVENKDGKLEIKKEIIPNFYYAYVDVKRWMDSGEIDIYLISDKDAKQIFGKEYALWHNNNYLEKPRESFDMVIKHELISPYKNKLSTEFKI